MMGSYIHSTDGDIVGAAWIEELHPYETLLQGTRMMTPFARAVVVRSRDVCEFNRDNLWGVTIIDDDHQGRPFVEAWMRRYGAAWPCVTRWDTHPELLRFYRSYARFHEEVHQHAFRCDIAFEREREVMWRAASRPGPP